MGALLIVGLILGYTFMVVFTATAIPRIVRKSNQHYLSNSDKDAIQIFGGPLWFFAWIILAGYLLGKRMTR